MKKLLIIPLLLLSLTLSATKYYCSPRGNNANNGADTSSTGAWRSWNYAMNHVTPSDTVYFLGGVYDATVGGASARKGVVLLDTAINGTYTNWTLFEAYPPDFAAGNYPILDCSDLTSANAYNVGLEISRVNYIHFKGLMVRNVPQTYPTVYGAGYGFYLWAENHSTNPYRPGTIKFENCAAWDIPADGFKCHAVDTLYVINCDAFDCFDEFTTDADVGGQGTGFNLGGAITGNDNVDNCLIYLNGCRAWNCSDQGYAVGARARWVMENCWSINAGNTPHEDRVEANTGSGIKLWYSALSGEPDQKRNLTDLTQVVIRNSIFAYAAFTGINWCTFGTANASQDPEIRCHIYNNFIYGSTYYVYNWDNVWGYGVGDGYNTGDTLGWWDHRYWNNVSYNNYPPRYDDLNGVRTDDQTGGYNYFDITGTPVQSTWFLSLDTTGMMGLHERESDWSLPLTDFGKPSSTSPLIDGGIAVGSYASMEGVDSLSFNGDAPDIGWFEYGTPDPGDEIEPSVIFTTGVYPGRNFATVRGNVFDDGGGYVEERGIVWDTVANPNVNDNVVYCGNGTGTYVATISDIIPSVTYYVRAYAVNEVGVSYGNELSFSAMNKVMLGQGAGIISYDNKIAQYTAPYTGETTPDSVNVTSIDIWGTGGATTITSNGGTLQILKKTLPTNATDTAAVWSRINRTGSGSINANGLLTASGNGVVTVRADAHDDSGVYDTLQITISNQSEASQIIADHTIVDDYVNIPQQYIDTVKKWWLSYAGESHSGGIRAGLLAVEALDSKFAVSVTDGTTPEAYTTSNLRASRATWGDVNNATGWRWSYGEEDWYTSATAIARTKAGLDYYDATGPVMNVFAYGWCWDACGWVYSTADPVYGCRWVGHSVGSPQGTLPWGLDSGDSTLTGNSVDLDSYLEATQAYIDHCETNGYATKVIFTTGPVDGYNVAEIRYQRQLKYDRIRDYVLADADRILFDYADILCYDDDGTPTTGSWNGNTYYTITDANYDAEGAYHISATGELRLGKAMWWLLARMAGWDGNSD